jgi:hypothetical protein
MRREFQEGKAMALAMTAFPDREAQTLFLQQGDPCLLSLREVYFKNRS